MRKRVRPPGSVAKTTVAERGSMRYTCHGGGPCDGALNGAVMPGPLSSGSAGQPLSAHAFAMRANASGSVTRTASPSITTSASRIDTATEHRGSRATLRPLRVPAPVWNQNVPSTQRAPTAVTCGLLSSLMVDSHVVREFAASGDGVDPASSFPATTAQSTGGSPSALPRLMISIYRTYLAVLPQLVQSATRLAAERARRGSRVGSPGEGRSSCPDTAPAPDHREAHKVPGAAEADSRHDSGQILAPCTSARPTQILWIAAVGWRRWLRGRIILL